MTGLVFKIIACPLLLFISTLFYRQISYQSVYQLILTALAIAIVLHMVEHWELSAHNVWFVTAIDFVVATLLIYFSQYIFANTYISMDGAIIGGILINISEHFQHNWLIFHRKVS